MEKGLEWSCVFGVAILRLWFWRNQYQFNQLWVDTNSMIQDVVTRAEEILCMNKSGLTKKGSKLEKWVSWQNPAWPWCKLNSDGACKSNTISTVGGLLRD